MRYTRHFDRLALRPIKASAPQNWGSLSTTSLLQIPKSWGESVSISRSYDRNDFQGRYTTPKKSHFCLDSFSLVSTIFSILSSLSGSTRPHLALETQNFRNSDEKNVKNLHSKCEKCNFDQNFRPRKKNLFFHFLHYGARSRPPVDGIQSKTQKFVDTDENEPIQNSSKFIKISSTFDEIAATPPVCNGSVVDPHAVRCGTRRRTKAAG